MFVQLIDPRKHELLDVLPFENHSNVYWPFIKHRNAVLHLNIPLPISNVVIRNKFLSFLF